MSREYRTLVLNSEYLPLSIFPLYTISAEDAIVRYLNGSCQVVEWYDHVIQTPSRTDLRWPSIIANHNSHSFRKEVRLKRESLYYRDHCRCVYCDEPITIASMTYDHMVPRTAGGKHVFENVVAACARCNEEKGSKPPIGRWAPRRKPWKPDFYQMLNIRKKYPIMIEDESWLPYLNWEAEVTVRNKKNKEINNLSTVDTNFAMI